MALTPESEVRFLRGVGERRMQNYRKLGADNKVDALAEAKSIGLIL